MKSLDQRVAIVTGAARGIGRGIAEVLAGEGARVVIADLDGGAAEELARRLGDQGRDALAVQVDLVDHAAVDALAATALDSFGRIDILAANAGIYPSVPLSEMSGRDWDHVMDVNARGALYAIQACLPAMRRRQYGRIVLTSSITGPIVGMPGLTHYAASKAALLGMMRSAALELAADGVTVNAILPGNVRTPGLEALDEAVIEKVIAAIPLGRLAEPYELGWAVRFLASEEAGYITGQTLIVDGGQVLPEILT